MKMKFAVLVSAIVVLGLAGSASATYWGDFSGDANCEGYFVSGQVLFSGPRTQVDVVYNVTLSQNGTPLATVAGTSTVYVTSPTFYLAGSWGMDLCGDYTVNGFVELQTLELPPNRIREFTVSFTCECGDDVCHYTPGYWKNHPEAWPVTSLTLGAITYDQAQLLAILNTPVRGDATIILAYHLIAAKLNVANGADPTIQGAIDQADAYLTMYPVGSNPPRSARGPGLLIKDELAAYNEMGCPDEPGDPYKTLGDPAEEEASSWGSLKAQYR